MVTTDSALDIEQLVREYVAEHNWTQDRAHVRNTSKAVRSLVRGLVETGSVNQTAMTIVYNLCQNDQALKPETKKQKINSLDIDDETKAELEDRIDDGTGTVGKGAYRVPIEGYEDEAFEFLATAIRTDDRDVIDPVIEDFASLDVHRVQAAIISTILYFLHPTMYPISNDLSRTEMEKYFGYEMSPQLTGYLDDVEKFHEVRATYPFEEDFRHLDSFFIWSVRRDGLPGPVGAHANQGIPEGVDCYWVNQKRNVELEGEFLRSPDRQWQRDLTVLEPGDLVFHYTDQVVRACSVVTSEVYQTEMDDGEHYRADVSTTWLDDPLPLSVIRDPLQDPEVKQDYDRYPLDKNGGVIQAYLCHLSPKAGEYLLAEADIDIPEYETPQSTNYFWVTANPSIWSVDEIADGSDVFYSAYNEKGNKKRLFEAFTSASPGDRVLFYESTPVKEIVAEGTVIEGFNPNSQTSANEPVADTDTTPSADEADADAGIQIRVDRRVDGISWDELDTIPELDEAAPITNRARGSLFPLTEAQFETILALEESVTDAVPQEMIDQFARKLRCPNVTVSIPDGLYFEDAAQLQREIEASLHSGKHVILTGPPGTGKTKLAKQIGESATTYDEIDDYRFTTATSEWTAFDTIGGYVPSIRDGVQELQFEPRLFLKCFRQDRVVNEWLIIDEINRSDIDKAFGQLFSTLSGDSTELPYERDRTVELLSLSESTTEEELEDIITNPDAFPVTPSWRLIATMNTYDKTSLYEMSYAFMRRFNFVHVGVPELTTDDAVRTSLLDPDGEDNYATAWLTDDDTLRQTLQDVYPVVAVLWQRINEHRVIGPSIVYDILRYLDSYEDSGGTRSDSLTSAVVSLVYPQLEGMRPEQQKRLIRSLTDENVTTENGAVDLALDQVSLQRQATDFFGITFDDDT